MTDALPATGLQRATLLAETWLLLGLSLGASALWSLLSLIDKLTKHIALAQQTTSMNNSVTPDRPWLDLAYQLLPIALGVLPLVQPEFFGVHTVDRNAVCGLVFFERGL